MENNQKYASMSVEDLKLELCHESDQNNIDVINSFINQKSGDDTHDSNLPLH